MGTVPSLSIIYKQPRATTRKRLKDGTVRPAKPIFAKTFYLHLRGANRHAAQSPLHHCLHAPTTSRAPSLLLSPLSCPIPNPTPRGWATP
eukprot:9428007-Pyramimonas_sp.AAC.1